MQILAPPSSAVQGADVLGPIQIAGAIEKIYAEVPFDANLPWKLCRVPVDQIEPKGSKWDRIRSAKGISCGWKSLDDKFYSVAVNQECLPWLRSHAFQFKLDLDPLELVEAEVWIHGRWVARCNAEDRFLKAISEQVSSGCGPGPESCYRELVPQRSQSQFEWISFCHDVLEEPDSCVVAKFTKWLLFIGLNLCNDYDKPPAIQLLGKDQHQILQVFRDIRRSFDNWHRRISCANFDGTCLMDLHQISILRNLWQHAGGRRNFLGDYFDPNCTAIDNANLFGALVDISGSNPIGMFDVQKMRSALSTSKWFANDTATLDIGTLTIQITSFLPFDFALPLRLPREIVSHLRPQEVKLIRVQTAYVYHKYPSLKDSNNDVLVLLIWSSIDPTVDRVVKEWASSEGGSDAYERMIEAVQRAQTGEQLGLVLAALLYHRRHLPTVPIKRNIEPTHGSYILDFDALLNGNSLPFTQAVLERMVLSILRVLDSYTYEKILRNVRQFLTIAIGTSVATPILHPMDAIADGYWEQRLCLGVSHIDGFQAMQLQHVTEIISRMSVDGVENTAVE